MQQTDWLSDEPKGSAIPAWLLKAVFILFGAGFIGVIIASTHGIIIPENQAVDILITYNQFALIVMLLFGGFIEEFIFRFIPITIGMNGFKSLKLTIVLCIISSLIFGYVHGNFANIFTQGFIGLAFWGLYLKFGAVHRKIIKPYCITSIVHALFNYILIAMYKILT